MNRLITYTFWKEINPEKDLSEPPHPKKTFPREYQVSHSHALSYPSGVDLNTIKTNVIWDNPITKSDINLMECLYWPDVPTIKGKTTRWCPHKLVSDVVSIPHELHDTQCDVCLYIDKMYINGMPFLTTISNNIKYCTGMWVADCTAPTIASLVECILKLYQQLAFKLWKSVQIANSNQFSKSSKMVDGPSWPFLPMLSSWGWVQ